MIANMPLDVIRNISNAYDIAVVIATEIPPYQDTPIEEYRGVIDVIRNRLKDGRFGATALEVVWTRNQFSAVGREPYWIKAADGRWFPTHVERCLRLWNSTWQDTTNGALYYYSPISMKPTGKLPNWNFRKLEECEVEGVRPSYFKFFREV